MGLEAVSRGAAHVVLVEQDRKIFNMLEENIATLECDDVAFALQCDALSSIPLLRAQSPLDVALVDPPYSMMINEQTRELVFEQMKRISPILDGEGFIVLRTPLNPNIEDHSIEGLAGPEIHKEGTGMWILFYGKQIS